MPFEPTVATSTSDTTPQLVASLTAGCAASVFAHWLVKDSLAEKMLPQNFRLPFRYAVTAAAGSATAWLTNTAMSAVTPLSMPHHLSAGSALIPQTAVVPSSAALQPASAAMPLADYSSSRGLTAHVAATETLQALGFFPYKGIRNNGSITVANSASVIPCGGRTNESQLLFLVNASKDVLQQMDRDFYVSAHLNVTNNGPRMYSRAMFDTWFKGPRVFDFGFAFMNSSDPKSDFYLQLPQHATANFSADLERIILRTSSGSFSTQRISSFFCPVYVGPDNAPTLEPSKTYTHSHTPLRPTASKTITLTSTDTSSSTLSSSLSSTASYTPTATSLHEVTSTSSPSLILSATGTSSRSFDATSTMLAGLQISTTPSPSYHLSPVDVVLGVSLGAGLGACFVLTGGAIAAAGVYGCYGPPKNPVWRLMHTVRSRRQVQRGTTTALDHDLELGRSTQMTSVNDVRPELQRVQPTSLQASAPPSMGL